MPLIVTWDEVFTEDEHRVANEIKKLIHWDQPFEIPSVAILVNDTDFTSSGKLVLIKYEKLFSRLAVDYRFIENMKDAKPGDWLIQPNQKFDSVKYANPANLPENVRKKIPFVISKDYATHYSLSADRKTMIAYIYNQTNFDHRQFYLGGDHNRLPKQGNFELSMANLPENIITSCTTSIQKK